MGIMDLINKSLKNMFGNLIGKIAHDCTLFLCSHFFLCYFFIHRENDLRFKLVDFLLSRPYKHVSKKIGNGK